MSKKANPAAIGVFVLVALAAAAAALVILGSGKLFNETRAYVLFFEGSLSGLDVGAPVEYHGVRVGNVTKIVLLYDTEDNTLQTPVYIELEPDRLTFKGDISRIKMMSYHIEKGLRAQLQAQSLVTGKLKIMLIDSPDSQVRLVGKDPDTPELPTIPTLTESLTKSLQELPLSDIVLNLNKSMESIAQFTTSSKMSNSFGRVASILEHVDVLTSNVNRSLPSVFQAAQTNADQLIQVQHDISDVLVDVKNLMSSQSPERQQFTTTMRSLEEASLALRDLLAYLQLHPEALITGKKEK